MLSCHYASTTVLTQGRKGSQEMTTSAAADIEKHGFAVLYDVLSASQCDEIQGALRPYEQARNMNFGRTDFEGTRTTRIYALAGKADGLFMRLVAENAKIIAAVDDMLFPNYLLSTFQSIRMFPGEKGQEWHTDDSFYGLMPRPRPGVLGASVIVAVEDFTAKNGATVVIPGSHRWGAERPEEHVGGSCVHHKVVMPAGSCVVFDGSLWHHGGTNESNATRLALSPQYCQPWLRTQESQLLICPPDIASVLSARGRQLVGYSIHPPFLGQVDGMHPLRLLDPAYHEHKTADGQIAASVLRRPRSYY